MYLNSLDSPVVVVLASTNNLLLQLAVLLLGLGRIISKLISSKVFSQNWFPFHSRDDSAPKYNIYKQGQISF